MTRPDTQLDVEVGDDLVAVVEFSRGPNNFFDFGLIDAVAAACEELARTGRARAVVLCSRGRHFCAGADFAAEDPLAPVPDGQHLYDAAVRMFAQPLPVVAAVQGAAVGGGLGLALACDFRFATAQSRFWAPFASLGIHHGFGLTVTLPRAVGMQATQHLLFTASPVDGEQAHRMGLVDRLVPAEQLRPAARAYAADIAAKAPMAVQSMRATLRAGLVDAVRAATDHERAEQAAHRLTADHAEGVRAGAERRPARFVGR